MVEEIERKVEGANKPKASNEEGWLETPMPTPSKQGNALADEEIDRITQLLLSTEDGAFELAITVLKTHGVSINYIVLDLIPTIARRLGKQWEDDTLSFAEVSIGVNKLERVIHKLDYLFQVTQLEKRGNHSILITNFPESQHSLGTLILSNYFIHSGWRVYRPENNSLKSIAKELESISHNALAISISCDEQLELLPNIISTLRGKSKNPKIKVLIGGPLYNKAPEKFAHIEADITAFTPEESVERLELVLSQI
ncbi:cobalamin B12-binding domain-containing protein [Polynucleobacter corsicus]|uniref:cobalamin B12-binding domain-containing protein n=1 Tax=Polynucleobacter corsicus TaxID=2081042 RepID=UPI001BFCF404|nr:cobalamin B12-binding domain-containing protein [Polynucleobacter corsicus]QWE18032.1 cobalamin B12-binding domain-containing protein [Polynucleobacter corsicus]